MCFFTLKSASVYTAAPTELKDAMAANKKAIGGIPGPVEVPSISPIVLKLYFRFGKSATLQQ